MAGWGALVARLQDLEKVPSQTATAAAKSIGKLIDEEFSAGDNPYGKAWAALRPATIATGRRPPPLTDTGKMRAGVKVKAAQNAGIVITVDADYAKFHQTGTDRMAQRAILPAGKELPDDWQEAIEDAFEKAVRKRMR